MNKKTAQVKHSELPWSNLRDCNCEILQANGEWIASTYTGEEDEEKVKEEIANTKFIIQACNSHYDLLEALKGMMNWARRVKELNPGMEIRNACVAIQKAEGRG
jgi:Tfp pilus assembly protein PilX